jgi:RNA recognition motif-containing protein
LGGYDLFVGTPFTYFRFGEVGDVYIPRHFGSGDPKGYAFVRFHSFQEAEDAITGMNGQQIQGRELRVQMAQNKRPEDPKSHYARGYDT